MGKQKALDTAHTWQAKTHFGTRGDFRRQIAIIFERRHFFCHFTRGFLSPTATRFFRKTKKSLKHKPRSESGKTKSRLKPKCDPGHFFSLKGCGVDARQIFICLKDDDDDNDDDDEHDDDDVS